MTAEARIAELKLVLSPAPKPVATYVPCVQVKELVYVSGHGPLKADKTMVTGRVGADLSEAEGKRRPAWCGLAILASLRNYLGSLDRVVRLVKVLGMVNAASDFQNHPAVVNGFSDLMVEVFGEPGKGARSDGRHRVAHRVTSPSKSRRFSRCVKPRSSPALGLTRRRRPWGIDISVSERSRQ